MMKLKFLKSKSREDWKGAGGRAKHRNESETLEILTRRGAAPKEVTLLLWVSNHNPSL